MKRSSYTSAVQSAQSNIFRLGTRGSLLAFTQSKAVADQLQMLRPDVRVELSVIKTTGDKITDRPLHDVGGKGLFTKELEIALLNGEIDFAVHSYKDVPVTMPLVDVSELVIAAVPTREDSRDVLVGGHIRSLQDLPTGARVGTGSLRRRCQLLQHRPDLVIVPIRGNIDTRLKKQTTGELDAVILAAAGLKRAKLFDAAIMTEMSAAAMVPAAAQGALALQCRADDQRTRGLLEAMNDPAAQFCTSVERKVIRLLNADCHSPIGVFAELVAVDQVRVHLAIGEQNSDRVVCKTVVSRRGSILRDLSQVLNGIGTKQ